MKHKPSISHDEAVIRQLRDDPEFAAEYLKAALEDSAEQSVLLVALRRITEARGGFAKVAKAAGIERESLHRALSARGNPRLSTLVGVMHAIGDRTTADIHICGMIICFDPFNPSWLSNYYRKERKDRIDNPLRILFFAFYAFFAVKLLRLRAKPAPSSTNRSRGQPLPRQPLRKCSKIFKTRVNKGSKHIYWRSHYCRHSHLWHDNML